MRRISQSLFLCALLLVGFAAGSATDIGRELMAAAETTFRGAWQGRAPPAPRLKVGRFAEIAASDAAAQRVRLFAPTLAGAVVIAGGRHRFRDHCPGDVGCLAVEYDRQGRFVHAYPFRPEAYETALVPHGFAEPVAYERAVGFDFAEHADVYAVDVYSNGDLAVTLHSRLSWPPYLGVARVDRDGRPRWYRADDGSHHWPSVAHGRLRGVGAGLEDALLVPGLGRGAGWLPGVRPRRWEVRMGRGPCAMHIVDYLHVIDGDGALLQRLSVTEALRSSPHAPALAYTINACDPLHLNSVEVLTAAGPSGLAVGDFLVSLRNLGALAVLDGGDGHLKRIWRGDFYGQHGARELAGPAGPVFLVFDNWGRHGEYEPGRLRALEARSGRVRTIHPNASSPVAVRVHSQAMGGVSVAPDGSRAIVFAHDSGQGVEIDLASGETTAVFDALDYVSGLAGTAGLADKAYRWPMKDIRYVPAPATAGR